jgi:hypothetical protein
MASGSMKGRARMVVVRSTVLRMSSLSGSQRGTWRWPVVVRHVRLRPLRPRLVVADATVDQDRVVRGTNDIGLKAQDQRVGGVDRPRIAQLTADSRPGGRESVRKQITHRQERGLLLDEAVNREVAVGEFEAHCRSPVVQAVNRAPIVAMLRAAAALPNSGLSQQLDCHELGRLRTCLRRRCCASVGGEERKPPIFTRLPSPVTGRGADEFWSEGIASDANPFLAVFCRLER